MRFFPHEEFYIKTSLSQQKAMQRLNDNMQPLKVGLGVFQSSIKYFDGIVVKNVFKLRRNVESGRSPQLQTTCEIKPLESGSKVHVKIQLQPFASIFLSIWLSIIGFAAVAITIGVILSGRFSPFIFIIYFMFLFGLILAMSRPEREYKIIKDQLIQILDGTMDNEFM